MPRDGQPEVGAVARQDLVLMDELAAATHHRDRGALLEEWDREQIDPDAAVMKTCISPRPRRRPMGLPG